MIEVFIVSLAGALERRKQMQSEILKFRDSMNFTFFDAIDARNKEQMQNFSKHYHKLLAKIVHGRELRGGEIACYASHFSLWKKCVELDRPIIVLEDDVELLENFKSGVEEIIESEYDFVRMYSTFNQSNQEKGLVIRGCKLGGTLGYYLTPIGAKILLKHSQKWFGPVDDYLDRYFIHGLPAVVYQPYLLKEQIVPSTIGDRTQKPRGIFKITREITRIYWGFLRSIFVLRKFFKG